MSFKKNTAVTGFTFHLRSATDGSDITTGTPVGYFTLDGGAQTAIGDTTPVHEGNGEWSVDLLAAEMNGDLVALIFVLAGAITSDFKIKTDTKLTSELNDISATAIVSGGAINTTTGAVDTVTTNSDMRGTDGANTTAPDNTSIASILTDTAEIGIAGVGLTNIGTIATVTNLTNLPAIPANWLTAAGIDAAALNGKGDWNIGKTAYSLTQAFPANFADLSVEVTTGRIDVAAIAGTAQTANDNGADINTILVHSSELQANQGAWATATGFATEVKQDAQDLIITDARLSELDAATVGKAANQIDIIQTDTTTDLPAQITTAQNDLDIITGVDGVNLLSATQTSINEIETDTSTSLPALIDDLAVKKNTLGSVHIEMVLASDHVTPATAVVVTAQALIDNGVYANVTGTMTEISNGTYRFDYTAADANGDMITWKFSATNADDTKLTFKTVA